MKKIFIVLLFLNLFFQRVYAEVLVIVDNEIIVIDVTIPSIQSSDATGVDDGSIIQIDI